MPSTVSKNLTKIETNKVNGNNSDQTQTELSEESNESLNTTIKCVSNDHVDSSKESTQKTTASSSDENMNRSVVSLHSKMTNYMCDEDDYNELHNLELCPIVVSDADEASYIDDLSSKITETSNNKTSYQYNWSQTKTSNYFNCSCTHEYTSTNTTKNKTDANKNNSEKCFCAKNVNSNNNNNNTIVNNYTNVSNVNNISSIISVPLNNYLFYNYERKEEEKYAKKAKSPSQRPKSGISTTTDSESSANGTLNRPLIDETVKSSYKAGKKLEKVSGLVTSSNSHNLNVESHLKNPDSKLFRKEMNLNTSNDKKTKNPKHRHSYFSSCSSCDSSIKESTITNTVSLDTLRSPRYHSISIIFIIIGLFSINILQESFLLFYYFNTEQFNWLISSLVALFAGQTLTLILSLLTEIDLINFTPPTPFNKFDPRDIVKLTSTSSSSSQSSAQSTPLTKPKKLSMDINKTELNSYKCSFNKESLINEQNIRLLQRQTNERNKNTTSEYLNSCYSYNNNLYSIFKNPFSKLCLLIPGYLPISVFIQFFKHLYHYHKSSGEVRFKYEFQLSLYLFFNAIFHNLPLAIINSCYLASTSTSHSFSWYYTEIFSFFSATASYFHTADSNTILINDANMEKRNQLVLLIVSIFISISIGVCLFITYFELMKQMNYLSVWRHDFTNQIFSTQQGFISSIFLSKNNRRKNSENDHFNESKLNNLGLVEILVYFCYKFCLITSRLAIISLFWYLFNEWLLLAFTIHVLISYLSTFLTIRNNEKRSRVKIDDTLYFNDSVLIKNKANLGKENENFNTSTDKSLTLEKNKKGFNDSLKVDSSLSSNEAIMVTVSLANTLEHKPSSKLNQHLTLFIICLLSFIDLFMNQLSEIYHIKKVVTYYVIYLVQNLSVLTYWLIKSIMNAREQLELQQLQPQSSHLNLNNSERFRKNEEILTESVYDSNNSNLNRNILLILKSSSSPLSTASNILKQPQQQSLIAVSSSSQSTLITPATFACYTSVIYLCFVLFTIFGIVLKFLHLHINRKRFRKLYS